MKIIQSLVIVLILATISSIYAAGAQPIKQISQTAKPGGGWRIGHTRQSKMAAFHPIQYQCLWTEWSFLGKPRYSIGSLDEEQATPLSWIQLAPDTGNFKVKLPKEPKLEIEHATIGNVTIDLNVYTSTNSDDDTHYAFTYYDFNGSFDLESSIKGIAGDFARRFEGKVKEIKKISYRGCAGFEAITTSVLFSEKVRVFKSGHRLFNLVIVYGNDVSDQISTDASYFFNSFEIKGGCIDELELKENKSGGAEASKKSTIIGIVDPSTGWKWIRSASDHINFLFPTDAEVTETPSSENGIALTARAYASDGGQLSYSLLTIGDYPLNYMKDETLREAISDKMINSFQNAIRRYNSSLEFSRPTKLGNYSGREYIIKDESNLTTGLVRLFVVSGKVYLFIAKGPRGDETNENIKRFFSSISLVQ